MLREHFQAVAERARIPQVAFALTVDGDLVESGDVDVQARICSMTKSFTAVALLQLRDAAVVDLDEPVAAYVPETSGWRHRPTVRHLLTMTGGLPTDDPWADRCLDWTDERFDAFLRGGVTFAREPGVRFEYANLGWAVLGRLITNVAGVRVQDHVTANVLAPLGLTRTTWTAVEPALAGHAVRRDRVVVDDPPLGDGAFAPMGGLWSTPRDISRWMMFLMDGDDAVLAPASRAEMQTSHVAAIVEDRFVSGYGYGLFVERDDRLGGVVQHPGGLPGFGSSMCWLPDRRTGVVALANLTYAPMTPATRGALDLVDAPPGDHAAATELALRLAALLADWTEDAEQGLFADNVFLDVHREERLEDAAALGAELGAFAAGDVDTPAPTYATVTLTGDGGTARLRVWLTAERPPRIQRYVVER